MTAWTQLRPHGRPDGRLIFQASDAEGVYRLHMIDPRSPGTKTRLTSSAVERSASISPDGRWLAFVMTQDGRSSVYVQRFPGAGPAVQVSLALCRESVLSAAGSRALPAARSAGDRHVVGREGRPIRHYRGAHCRHRSLADHDRSVVLRRRGRRASSRAGSGQGACASAYQRRPQLGSRAGKTLKTTQPEVANLEPAATVLRIRKL